jgi:hypothetical protein
VTALTKGDLTQGDILQKVLYSQNTKAEEEEVSRTLLPIYKGRLA